jgi:hypothetical protein
MKKKARKDAKTRKSSARKRKSTGGDAARDGAQPRTKDKAKTRKAAPDETEGGSDEGRSLDAKARLTAAKLFRRLRKSVQREGRGATLHDEEALGLLARVGEQAVEIARAALDDDRWQARYAAVATLLHLQVKGFKLSSEVVEDVAALIRDDDSQVRHLTVELLGLQRAHFRQVMPSLVKALGDRNAEVSRTAVAQVLELSPSRRALTKTMIKVLEGKRSQLAKIGAMMVLFHLGKAAKEAAPVLLPFLEDEAAEVREYAHLALMGIRTPSMRIQIERTASMRLKVKDALASSAEREAVSGDLTEEELDELSELGEVESELGSTLEVDEPEPKAPRKKGRSQGRAKKKGVAPRKRRGLAAKRRRRF